MSLIIYICLLGCSTTNDISVEIGTKPDGVCYMAVSVCFHLCVLNISLQIHVWINWVWFHMVSAQLLMPVAPPVGVDRGRMLRLGLPVGLHSRLVPHGLRTCPRRLLPLPVGVAVGEARGQLVTSRQWWADLLACS